MPIRWDPLLVRELARELHARLAGSRARALRLDGDARRLTLLLRGTTLEWNLHPSGGAPLLLPPADPAPGDLPLPGRIRSVTAPPDERVLVVELLPEKGRPPRDLVVELLGNQWNALVVERPAGTVRHVLVRRGPPRPARVGAPYVAPPPSAREGVAEAMSLERWREVLAPVPPPQRRKALVASVAWTSPLVAAALVDGDPDPDLALEKGHALWLAWVSGTARPDPGLLTLGEAVQPYPFPLPGVDREATPSLEEAFRRLARSEPANLTPHRSAGVEPGVMEGLESALDASLRKVTRLQAALDQLPDEAALRTRGDLLLARLTQVPPGASRVTLAGFDGEDVMFELDPTLPGHENAHALYGEAARASRARERLPGLLLEAEERCRKLEELTARVRSGEAAPHELRGVVPVPAGKPTGGVAPSLPYRSFRSSGGLEIRVGRGSRHNDDLTFRHAAPGDVWLHARHAQGAHVILRWGKPGSPPGRDLEEAATLAALHSRARTSGVVPVDWTLRKHVRKPRGAAPGSVLPQSVKTLMVRPDPTLLERLAAE